jgi:hypothetical protein
MIYVRMLPPDDDRFCSVCKSPIQGRIDHLEITRHDSESAAGPRLHDESGQPCSEISLLQGVNDWRMFLSQIRWAMEG